MAVVSIYYLELEDDDLFLDFFYFLLLDLLRDLYLLDAI